MTVIKAYLLLIVFLSFADFFLFMEDKRRSRKKEWRIKEKSLLGISLLGGAFGAILGMIVFHHKTKHSYFWVINILSIMLHSFLLWRLLR